MENVSVCLYAVVVVVVVTVVVVGGGGSGVFWREKKIGLCYSDALLVYDSICVYQCDVIFTQVGCCSVSLFAFCLFNVLIFKQKS